MQLAANGSFGINAIKSAKSYNCSLFVCLVLLIEIRILITHTHKWCAYKLWAYTGR